MMNLISRFALPIVVLAILVLLVRNSLLSSSPFVIAAQLLAVALSVWARASFGTGQFRVTAEPSEGGLLNRGPYRIIRHPMYAAAMLFIWASILGHWSLVNAIIGLAVTGVTAIRIVKEEQVLRQRYPEYSEYSRNTKQVIPYLL